MATRSCFGLVISVVLVVVAACSSTVAAAPPSDDVPGATPPSRVDTEPSRGPADTPVHVDNAADYFDRKILAIVGDHRISEGNFTLSVIPMTEELLIASRYATWTEKRLTTEAMQAEIQAQRPAFADRVYAYLTVSFVGDLLSSGRTQFEIPQDIAEYVFLENDRGQAIRCSRAELPMMHMPGPFTPQVDVQLEFSQIAAQHPDFFETQWIRFVVGGLDFRSNAVTYRYPLADLFGDAPSELRGLYRATGVWAR